MNFFFRYTIVSFLIGVSVFLAIYFYLLPTIFSMHYVSGQIVVRSIKEESADVSTSSTETSKLEIKKENSAPVPTVTHIAPPLAIKGVYMTSWIASAPSLRNNIVKLADSTEINTIVIDIKDYSGKIVFPIEDNPALKAYGSEDVRVKDMPQFIALLHSKGIYVVGRVAVFQDKYFVTHKPEDAVKNKSGTAVWKDHKGISWVDAGSREYWDYIVALAKESYAQGFDEVNFDYVRFPSDGNMKDISFPHSGTNSKPEIIKEFFAYLHNNLKDTGLKTSADLFGMTTTSADDLGIGQVLENALPYFDYIDPMVYPSHYPATFMGYKNPEKYPYEVIKFTMKSAMEREAKLKEKLSTQLASSSSETTPHLAILRPWLQDFGLTVDYGSTEVKAQIKATNDIGLNSWLLWSASNKYTVGALDSNTER